MTDATRASFPAEIGHYRRGWRLAWVRPHVAAAVILTFGLIFAAPAISANAAGWWNGDWQYRKAITITLPTADAQGMPTDIVVPIRLHAGNFEYFQDLQPGGTDVRFIAADGTPLKYQVEMLDPLVGLMVAWVQVPVKAGSIQQSVWMYYSNPHAPAAPIATVYDVDQTLVLHFAESQGMPRDATANHADPTAANVQLAVPGIIGNAAHFDGHGTVRIAARPELALSPTGGLTFSCWVKLAAGSGGGILYSQARGETHVEAGIDNNKLYTDIKDSGHTTRVEATIPVVAGEWHAVTVSIGTEAALYVDGAPAGAAPSGGLPEINADVVLGGGSEDGDTRAITADLDEVQISRVSRSPWWVRANTLAQSPSTTQVAYGGDEAKGSSGKLAAYLSMMGNLLSQVSLDGLVVITITALMGLASFQVLISKAALLRRVERQDAEFLAQFSDRFSHDIGAVAAREPVATVTDERYSQSGVYEMYRAGVEGTQAVIAASAGSRTMQRLTSEGFEAIRAALDSALVEVTNRLNARLVTMTVAIAGAPFLGLLGTVVGVMITFASIAAAGDVNVNTIAPGVAAAMTATVVGLLVAIPSLFGYNWLATRIARRTSAMEVFADQFLSRVGLFSLRSQTASGEPKRTALECTEVVDHAA